MENNSTNEVAQFELFKPRNFSEVIEDSFAFLKKYFVPYKNAFLKKILPLVIAIAVIEAISKLITPTPFSDNNQEHLTHFSGINILLSLASIVINIALLFRYISIATAGVVLQANDKNINFNTSDLLSKMKQLYWNVALGCICWIPIYIVFVLLMGFLIIPMFFADLMVVATIIFFFISVVFLPVMFFAMSSAFPASVFEQTNYFAAFFRNIRLGFSRFLKTWMIAFLVTIIFVIFSIIPVALVLIPELLMQFGGGPEFLKNIPFVLPAITLVSAFIANGLSTITSIIVFTIYGIYFFSLNEEIEGIAFREKMDESNLSMNG